MWFLLLCLVCLALACVGVVGVKRWWVWIGDLDHRRAVVEKQTIAKLNQPTIKKLSIVIPAYNEEKRLPRVLTATLQYLAKRRDREGSSFTYEVIVVDDGSSDRTPVIAWLCAKDNGAEDALSVISLERNRGKGAAVRCGMLAAQGDLVLMMDADGATELEHGLQVLENSIYERLLNNSKKSKEAHIASANLIHEAGGYKYVAQQPIAAFGSRAHLQEEDIVTKRSKLRNFAMHGFHLLVFLVVGGQIQDTQCGFKLFTREAAQAVFCQQRLERWCFDVEVLYLAQSMHIPVLENKVKWEEKDGSKLKFLHIFHMALELSTVLVCYKLGFWGIHSKKLL